MMDIKYMPATETDMEPVFEINKALIDEYENLETIDYRKVLSWVRNKIELIYRST